MFNKYSSLNIESEFVLSLEADVVGFGLSVKLLYHANSPVLVEFVGNFLIVVDVLTHVEIPAQVGVFTHFVFTTILDNDWQVFKTLETRYPAVDELVSVDSGLLVNHATKASILTQNVRSKPVYV